MSLEHLAKDSQTCFYYFQDYISDTLGPFWQGCNGCLAQNGRNHRGLEILPATMDILDPRILTNSSCFIAKLRSRDHLAGRFGPKSLELMKSVCRR